jgi:hypothetical protein
VEFLSGTAMLETVDAGSSVKDPAVTIVYKDFQTQPMREGIFELTSMPSQVRVFKGEAKVFGNDTSVNVKEGNMVELGMTMASAKFDAKDGDDLYLWSRDRSAYLSAGNMSSARTMATSGFGNGAAMGNGMGYGSLGFGSGYAYTGWNPAMWNGFSGGWYYNSYLNMYSYMPFAGTMYSPFGYGYYNPMTIGYVYTPGYYWTGAGGARTGTTTGVPLSTLPTVGSTATSGTTRTSGGPLLPRLGVTSSASVRPSLGAPARGTEPNAPTASLSARSGVGAPGSVGGVSNNVRSAAPVASSMSSGSVRAAATARR